MPASNTPQREPLLAAAALWALASGWYLLSEAIAAHAFPNYSYAHNYISDLGAVDSPLAEVMNLGFLHQGVLGILAALFAFRAFTPGSGRSVFLGLALVQGAGNILVGIFHSAEHAVWHVGGAFMAIVGGNLSLIVAGIVLRRLGCARTVPLVSVGLGIAGLTALAMLGVNMIGAPVVLDDGAWERLAVYPIIGWQLVAAVTVVAHGVRSRDRECRRIFG